jgi:hypothetical protein
MGDLFEELIRKFAEASNEEAGEHFTPRDAIRLIVDLLFAEDNDALLEPGVVRSVYDPTAGTGGMLSLAEDHLLSLNPEARLRLYGQEINDQSYAVCKSDMIAKGQDATNIRLGDTLAEDLFADRSFDYCMSNPPYGVDWRASEEAVKAERAATGAHGRLHRGCRRSVTGRCCSSPTWHPRCVQPAMAAVGRGSSLTAPLCSTAGQFGDQVPGQVMQHVVLEPGPPAHLAGQPRFVPSEPDQFEQGAHGMNRCPAPVQQLAGETLPTQLPSLVACARISPSDKRCEGSALGIQPH